MGIPLVSLAGETTASRSGASLLAAVGLSDLVAGSDEEYLEIAAALARDPARLAAISSGLARAHARLAPHGPEQVFAQS
jgi:predicted O-linked N-acetylglucosamine transferase (SPINDLY family)